MNIPQSETEQTPLPTTPNPWAHVKLRTAKKKSKKKKKANDNDEIRIQIEKLKNVGDISSNEIENDGNFLSAVHLRPSANHSPRDLNSIPGSPLALYIDQKNSLRVSARFSNIENEPLNTFENIDSENSNENIDKLEDEDEKEVRRKSNIKNNIENKNENQNENKNESIQLKNEMIEIEVVNDEIALEIATPIILPTGSTTIVPDSTSTVDQSSSKVSGVRFTFPLKVLSADESCSDSESSIPLKHFKQKSSFDYNKRMSTSCRSTTVIYNDIECDSDDYLPSSTEREFDDEDDDENDDDDDGYDDEYEDYHDDDGSTDNEWDETGLTFVANEKKNDYKIKTKIPDLKPYLTPPMLVISTTDSNENIIENDNKCKLENVNSNALSTPSVTEIESNDETKDSNTPSVTEICIENVKRVLTSRKESMFSDGEIEPEDDMEWLFDEDDDESEEVGISALTSHRSASMHALFTLLMRTDDFTDVMPTDMQIDDISGLCAESSCTEDMFSTPTNEIPNDNHNNNKKVSFSEPESTSKYMRIHYPSRSSTSMVPKYSLPRISTVLDNKQSEALCANLKPIGEGKILAPALTLRQSNPVIANTMVTSPTLRKINKLSMFSGNELQTLTFQALVNTIPVKVLVRCAKYFSVIETKQILKLVKKIGKLVIKGELCGTYAEEYGLYLGDTIVVTHTASPADNECLADPSITPCANEKFINKPQGSGMKDCIFFDGLNTNCVQLKGYCKVTVGGVFGDGKGVGFGVLSMPVSRNNRKFKQPVVFIGLQCITHGIMIDLDDRLQITDHLNNKFHIPIGGMNGWNVKSRVNFMIVETQDSLMKIVRIIAFKYLSFSKPIERRIQICTCDVSQLQAFIQQHEDIGRYYCSKLMKPPTA